MRFDFSLIYVCETLTLQRPVENHSIFVACSCSKRDVHNGVRYLCRINDK